MIIRTRTLARERAMQFLYSLESNNFESTEQNISNFWDIHRAEAIFNNKAKARWTSKIVLPNLSKPDLAARKFAERLIKGVLEKKEELDLIISKHAKNWKLNRIASVDRNILRLAIYEMHYCLDIPPIVSINEAVNIAKKYSTDESGKFVNGILDNVREEILRSARQGIDDSERK